MKYIMLFIGVIFLAVSIGSTAKSEEIQPGFQIVFNEAGTHFHNEKFKIELDLIPVPGTKIYEKCNLYVPIIPDNATPEQLHDPVFLSKLDYQWIVKPALRVFVEIDKNTTVEKLQEYIDKTFTANMSRLIDNYLLEKNAIHYISPLLRELTVVEKTSGEKVAGDIESVNFRFKDVQDFKKTESVPVGIKSQSIDVGNDAIDRDTYAHGQTFLDGVACTANGTIDTVEWYSSSSHSTNYAGTFFNTTGTTFQTRDSESLGGGGSGYDIYTGLDITIITGDYFGGYSSFGSYIDKESSGGSCWYYVGEKIDPGDYSTYSSGSYIFSIHGTGEELASAPSVTTGNITDIGTDTFTAHGTVTDNGGDNVTIVGFYYDSDNVTEPYSTPEFSITIDGLTSNTTYNVQAFAINGVGIGTGSTANVTTLAESEETEGDNVTSNTTTIINFSDMTFDSSQFWIIILCSISMILLFVNFFRFNIIFVLASVFVNIGITQIPGVPTWLWIAAVLIALGEIVAGTVKLVWGRKNKKRFTG